MDRWDENSVFPDHRGYPEDQGSSWDRYPASEPYGSEQRVGGQHEMDPYGVGPGGSDPYAVDGTASGPSPYAPGPVGLGGPAPYGPPAGFSGADLSGAGYPGSGFPGDGIAGGPQHPGYPGGLYALMPPTSGMAVTGFILGLLSFILCPGLLAPAGLIFSILGVRETSARRDIPRRGRGLAIAGLVLSIVCLVLAALMLVLVVVLGMLSEPS